MATRPSSGRFARRMRETYNCEFTPMPVNPTEWTPVPKASSEAQTSEQESIRVRGARVHNLKNLNFEIPHNAITVVTGVSGSGKSSLAFDTMYAEGQRRYVESLSAYARQFLERMG